MKRVLFLLLMFLTIIFTYSQEFPSEKKIKASNMITNDCFGYSVSIWGDYAIIGSTSKNKNKGAAFIYRNHEDGTWEDMDMLIPKDIKEGDKFGYSVALYGDYAVVGAPVKNSGRGAAYIFKKNYDGDWEEEKVLEPSVDSDLNNYGISVSITENNIIIGAKSKDNNNGAAFIYKKLRSGKWSEPKKLLLLDPTLDQYSVPITSRDTVRVNKF